MLIPNEVLTQIDAEVTRIFTSLLKFIDGDGDTPPMLEQVFLAGKIASDVGPDRLKTMSAGEVANTIRLHGYGKTKEDAAILNLLRTSTNKWVASLMDDLSKRIRVAIASAEIS